MYSGSPCCAGVLQAADSTQKLGVHDVPVCCGSGYRAEVSREASQERRGPLLRALLLRGGKNTRIGWFLKFIYFSKLNEQTGSWYW